MEFLLECLTRSCSRVSAAAYTFTKEAIEDSVIGFGLISCKPQRLLERFFAFVLQNQRPPKRVS